MFLLMYKVVKYELAKHLHLAHPLLARLNLHYKQR